LSERVFAVVLNWNCAPDTIRCVRAVREGSVVPEIIVVDNGSRDDSLDALGRADLGALLIPLPDNLGYAGGMNAGIRAAMDRGATHVWLLNADCLPRADALAALLEQAGTYDVSASLQLTSAQPWGADAKAYIAAAMLPGGKVRPVECSGCAAGRHDVDVVTGAALFLATEWLAKVGLFDESFFHYKEEFDLVVRIAQAGGRVGLVCRSVVWHKLGGSLNTASPRARYYHYRNELLYVRKQRGARVWREVASQPFHYRVLAQACLGLVGGAGRRRVSRAVLAGYLDGLRGVHGPTERF
jgi:GT2 family glycosyltransferase